MSLSRVPANEVGTAVSFSGGGSDPGSSRTNLLGSPTVTAPASRNWDSRRQAKAMDPSCRSAMPAPRSASFPACRRSSHLSITSPQRDGLGHRPRRRGEGPGRGRQREPFGVVRAQPSPGPGDSRRGSEGVARSFRLLDGDLRRRRRRPHAGFKPTRVNDRRAAGRRRQGRIGRRAAEIQRDPTGTHLPLVSNSTKCYLK